MLFIFFIFHIITNNFISKKKLKIKNQNEGVIKKLKNKGFFIAKYKWKKKINESHIIVSPNEIKDI